MNGTVINAAIQVRYPAAFAPVTTLPEALPGMLLNEVTYALAAVGAGVDEIRLFRTLATSGDWDTLLTTICSWVYVC
jgi:hypothetical protein